VVKEIAKISQNRAGGENSTSIGCTQPERDLTYKSNFDIVLEHTQARPPRIVKFVPNFFDRDETEVRRLYMLPELFSWLHQEGLPRAERDYRANIRDTLAAFVLGAKINNCDDLKLLEPHDRGLWELKITFTPQRRIFGAFLWNDTFFCLNHTLRNPLGRKGSRAWKNAENEALDLWRKFFGKNERASFLTFESGVTNGENLCPS
jgi:hypothetical protein